MLEYARVCEMLQQCVPACSRLQPFVPVPMCQSLCASAYVPVPTCQGLQSSSAWSMNSLPP